MLIDKDNETIKRKYRKLITETERITEKTVDSRFKSIYRFDDFLNGTSYKTFSTDQAIGFKRYLEKIKYNGNFISPQTIYRSLVDVKRFLVWLSEKPGYKSQVKLDDLCHLNPTGELLGYVRNQAPRKFPTTMSYAKKLILSIDASTEIGKRDRALLALIMTTGIRSEAVCTLRLGTLDINEMSIDQNPSKGVMTKFRKRIFSYILPIDSVFTSEIQEWHRYLVSQDLPSTYPLFPRTAVSHAQDTFCFINNTISDQFMRPNRVSGIIKKRTLDAGMKYYSAHALRHLHEYIVEKAATLPRHIKLLSQNMGHKHIATTMFQYGYIPEQIQVEELKKLDFRGIE
jgi:integrase